MGKKKESTLKNWDEVDANLKELCSLTIKKREIKNAQTRESIKMKEKWDEKIFEVSSKIDSITEEIARFADSRRDDFLKKRTKKLTFGSIKFRATRKISIKNAQSAIMSLKAMGMDVFIRKTETIDKKALLSLTDNELTPLSKAGVSVKREDKITVDPDIVELSATKKE